MASFYEKLVDIVIRQGLGSNVIIVKFITKLDQDIWGLGLVSADLCATFKNDAFNLKIFLDVITEAINELFAEKNYDAESRRLFIDFRDEVITFLLYVRQDSTAK